MKILTATEVARRFSEVLDAVEHGETFVVTRGGRTVARIGPAAPIGGRTIKAVLRRHHRDRGWSQELQQMRHHLVTEGRTWPG